MVKVLCSYLVVDQYIIKENEDQPVKEWMQNFVHQSLEGCQHVGEAEWHD
jgi:hypothetical protein